MEYIDIISENVKPEELLHEVASKIKSHHTAAVRALAQDKPTSAAGILGEMVYDVDLLLKVDEKLNGKKKSTSIIA